MTCVICKHGQMIAGHATVTLERSGSTLVFKRVPAKVRENCGEFLLDEQTTRELLQRAENAVKTGVEVEVLNYAA